jgi:hypothetical protein
MGVIGVMAASDVNVPGLPAGAGDECEDVVGDMPVKRDPGPVIARGGPQVGVAAPGLPGVLWRR